MTLPASGAISFTDLQTEFGGSTPLALGDYYKGGARVPNTAGNAAVPTTGAIALGDFYGGSAVDLPASVADDQAAIDPADATAAITFNRNGTFTTNLANIDWHRNASATIGDDYEVRLDISSGTLTSGTSGAWLSLSTPRTWTRQQTVVGTSSVDGTIRIRRADTGVEQDSAPFSLVAQVSI